MTNITPTSSVGFSRVEQTASADRTSRPGEDRTAGIRREGDQVELSNRSRALAQLRALPPIRTDIVSRVRDEIATNSYLTEDRIDLAVDALFDEVNFEA